MKSLHKFGCAAALALAATVFARADEAAAAEADAGAIGWSPITLGLCSPLQFPWGHCKWDVRGVSYAPLYYGECKLYGVGLALLGGQTADTAAGVQFAGLMNLQRKTSYGVRATIGANISTGESAYKGVDVSSFAYRHGVSGLDVQLLAAWQKSNSGCEVSGLFNYTKERSYGFQGAAGANVTGAAFGCQLAIFNWADELHGAQIGLVNYADDCEWGFQIGLVNIMLSNTIKFLPIVNAYF